MWKCVNHVVFQGFQYLISNGLLDEDPQEIARFLHFARNIDVERKRVFLETRWVKEYPYIFL